MIVETLERLEKLTIAQLPSLFAAPAMPALADLSEKDPAAWVALLTRWEREGFSGTDALAETVNRWRTSHGKAGHGFDFESYARRDPTTIPPRRWLYKPLLIRGAVTGTVAHGGSGKTALLCGHAVCVASGRDTLGFKPKGRFNVLLWNGEDGADELSRRVEAFCKFYGVAPEETNGRLFLASGRDFPIDLVAIDRETRMAVPRDTDALISALVKLHIDAAFLDPFISCHSVPENLNESIEKVAQQLNLVAERANVAVHVAHHSVKKRGEDVGAMDYRGGGAALAKLRYVQTLNTMQRAEAEKLGIISDDAWKYVRVDGDKPNITPPDKARWYFMQSVGLENADPDRGAEFVDSDVLGVPEPWKYRRSGITLAEIETADAEALITALRDSEWGQRSNAANWVGAPIAEALGIDLTTPVGKVEAKEFIKDLRTAQFLKLVSTYDENRHQVQRLRLDGEALRAYAENEENDEG